MAMTEEVDSPGEDEPDDLGLRNLLQADPRWTSRYEGWQVIGRGAFATVYEAVQVSLERDVALKVLDPLVARDGRPFGAGQGNRMRSSGWLYPSVVAGSYRLIVSSKGTYGDVGQYTISGTIVPSANYVAAPSTALAANSSGSVSVSWHDNSWNETSFSIERSDDGGSTWNVIGSADPGAHACIDSTVDVIDR